jgi:hypothetical protein
MAKIHTHYDNLKVTRNAPPEVIRAAYKTLSQKYHPDKNPGMSEAGKIMSIINASYEALIDPEKRRMHDEWISANENKRSPDVSNIDRTPSTDNIPKTSVRLVDVVYFKTILPIFYFAKGLFVWVFSYAIGVGAVIGVIWLIGSAIDYFGDKTPSTSSSAKPYQANPTAIHEPSYIRPSTAPNGVAWPTAASYVNGYKKLHLNGLSTVTVDNTRNDSDVFVKLVSIDGAQAYPVRVFYIPAYGSFALYKIRPGNYDIRYRDLNTGGLSKSESFTLGVPETYGGIQYSNITMTLYKVAHGNMQTYGIPESEF